MYYQIQINNKIIGMSVSTHGGVHVSIYSNKPLSPYGKPIDAKATAYTTRMFSVDRQTFDVSNYLPIMEA